MTEGNASKKILNLKKALNIWLNIPYPREEIIMETKKYFELNDNEKTMHQYLLKKEMATHYSCLENPMDGGAWQVAVHGVTKGQTRLSNFTFTFHFHAQEKEMATHSSVLAWRIPGMEEPSMGSHIVGHD